jgi:hypothetical protein
MKSLIGASLVFAGRSQRDGQYKDAAANRVPFDHDYPKR